MTERPSALPRYTHPLLAEDPVSVGPYLLLARIASGATGAVYLSRDSSGAWVAVRTPHPDHARRTDMRTRFAAAVERARHVSGRGTCAIVDAEPDAELPYAVFEFVDGPTLADEVGARGPLSPAELARVALDTAAAVEALHRARAVHGRLEASDVVLSVTGPRLVDLGVAGSLAALLPPGDNGAAAGVAPEVVAGRDATPASDVFGWAALVVFAATGSPPAKPVTGQLLAEAGLSSDLGELVARSLATDPAARPTAVEIVSRLAAPSPRRTVRRARAATPAAFPAAAFPAAAFPAAAFPGTAVPTSTAPIPMPATSAATTGSAAPGANPPAASAAAPSPAPRPLWLTTPPSVPAPQGEGDVSALPARSRGRRALVAGAVFMTVAAGAAAVAPAVSASGGEPAGTATEGEAQPGLDLDQVPAPVLAPSESPTSDEAAAPTPDTSVSPAATPPFGAAVPVVPLAPNEADEDDDAASPAGQVPVAPVTPAATPPATGGPAGAQVAPGGPAPGETAPSPSRTGLTVVPVPVVPLS